LKISMPMNMKKVVGTVGGVVVNRNQKMNYTAPFTTKIKRHICGVVDGSNELRG
jgi:hypothetical protein